MDKYYFDKMLYDTQEEIYDCDHSLWLYKDWFRDVIWEIVEPSDEKYVDNNDEFSFSNYQSLEWVIIKKQSENEYIENYRYSLYQYILKEKWKFWLDNLYKLINNTLDQKSINSYIDDFWYHIKWELIRIFVLIELELIWKDFMTHEIVSYFEEKIILKESIKIIWLFLYEKWYNKNSYIFFSNINKKEIINDIQLLEIYIDLESLFGNWDNIKYLLQEYNKNNEMDLIYYFEKYFEYYIRTNKDLDEFEDLSLKLIEDWYEDAYFVLIHYYISRWDFKSATFEYNMWLNKENDSNILAVDDFYLHCWDLWVENSMKLLIKYTKDKFIRNWFDINFFNKVCHLIRKNSHNIENDDLELIEMYIDYCDNIQNEENICNLINDLFMKCKLLNLYIFYDRLLLISSKYIHWQYSNQEIEKTITKRFEKLIFINESNQISFNDTYLWDNSVDLSVFEKWQYNIKTNFDELLIKFCLFCLQYLQVVWWIETLNNNNLTSIFDFYWIKDLSNYTVNYNDIYSEYYKSHEKNLKDKDIILF